MTHLEHVIRDVKMFIPKPSKNKKLKARVLSKLYAEEAKERKASRHRTKRVHIQPRQQHQKISLGISDFLRKRAERKREQRIQQAKVIQKIRESNLSEQTKKREQSKIGVPIYSNNPA